MPFLGDLERFVATNLYPLRIPIALAAILALAAVVIVARRRGWFAAARRHPGRAASLLAVVLLVGIPSGWYLASPLFIRTELIEPAPTPRAAVASPSPTAGQPSPTGPDRPSPAVTAGQPATPAAVPALVGTFSGADDFHFGRGTATLVETAPGEVTLRFEDFSVRNGPDLFVYLSPDPGGYADGAIELGPLKATDGSFNTPVPPGTDVTGIRSVVIWCRQFAVLFAVAPLG